ncbi:MAG: FAD-dependent oxidoreductase, partial [Polyangiaceae bacterium]|nr:FAD-dependent oxidoreductase [Polyangiaceae bacterium]
WLESVVLAVFSDGKIGVRRPDGYVLVEAEQVLVATGAREKSLAFPGNTLPGVYGAGAFQTLVNRDQVRCARRLLVIGGGNVGLIGAYHALQAGMHVAALVEALPKCGGYKVHADKIQRLGVPIHTSHSILAVHGSNHVEAATVTRLDDSFRPVPGGEKTFAVDTVLVAVGLNPVDELVDKARAFGIQVRSAGDAEQIAEASAAMFCGRVRGIEIARALGATQADVPSDLIEKANVLKRPAGARYQYAPPDRAHGVFPVLHCAEEIPCNPCMTVCPRGCIRSAGHPILGIPVFDGECDGCLRCVAICPGLAISLVDFRKQPPGRALVTLAFELGSWVLQKGQQVALTDWEGRALGTGVVRKVVQAKKHDRTTLLRIEVPSNIATAVAGVRLVDAAHVAHEPRREATMPEGLAYVCRCERVTVKDIRGAIRAGVRDLNELKGVCRSGMGACGGKTCGPLVQRICLEEGLTLREVMPFTARPLFAETQLGYFAGRRNHDD